MSDHVAQEVVQVISTGKPQKKSKDEMKPRGSNITPKSEMHVGRDWNHSQWNQAFGAYSKKLDKAAYAKRSEVK